MISADTVVHMTLLRTKHGSAGFSGLSTKILYNKYKQFNHNHMCTLSVNDDNNMILLCLIYILIGRAELNFGFDGAQSDQVHVIPDEIRSHLHGCQNGTDSTSGNDHSSSLEINGKPLPRPIFKTRLPFTYIVYVYMPLQ